MLTRRIGSRGTIDLEEGSAVESAFDGELCNTIGGNVARPILQTDLSNLAGRIGHSCCASAGSVARCAWIHRRSVWCARPHDGRAANILGCWYPLSAVRTEIAELLRLSAEVQCVYPASRFAAIAGAAVADLSDLVKSGLERTCNRSNDRLGNVGCFEGVAEREAGTEKCDLL